MAATACAEQTARDRVEARLKTEEGFRSKPYQDSRGVLTIGYGTNLAEGITVREAEWLLRNRLSDTERDLVLRWAPYDGLSVDVQAAVLDAAYQLGVGGLLAFHDMLAAVSRGDWDRAIAEAKDSAWAKETPARVALLVQAFEGEK